MVVGIERRDRGHALCWSGSDEEDVVIDLELVRRVRDVADSIFLCIYDSHQNSHDTNGWNLSSSHSKTRPCQQIYVTGQRHSSRNRLKFFTVAIFETREMSSCSNKKGKQVFRPFIGLVSWWKGRQYYFATPDFARDATSTTSGDNRLGPSYSQLQVSRRPAQENVTALLSPAPNVDFLQCSTESLDSATNSYSEPGDEISQTTTPASNTCYGRHDRASPF